jgi:hypothetical protein
LPPVPLLVKSGNLLIEPRNEQSISEPCLLDGCTREKTVCIGLVKKEKADFVTNAHRIFI